jgi:molybdate transport system permease protein
VILPADASPLIISVATTFAATVATFFLGLIAARLMYDVRGGFRAWIDGILTLPLVLPPTVVGFFLLLIFGRRSFIGRALEHIGVTIAFSWPATVIAATVIAFPLMYRTTLGAFEQVNPTLLEAARTLGASEWVVFRRVLLPLSGPGVIAGTVLAFARSLGEFGATLMLAGNIPGRTQTVLWVVLIVVVSLAIIRLLNVERKTRIVAQAELSLTRAEFPEQLPTAVGLVRGNASAAALDVDLERTLENFTLRIVLDASNGAVGLLGPSGSGKSMGACSSTARQAVIFLQHAGGSASSFRTMPCFLI